MCRPYGSAQTGMYPSALCCAGICRAFFVKEQRTQPVILNEDHIAVHGEGCVFLRIEVIDRKCLATLLRQIAQGHKAVLLDANLTENVSRLISDDPFAERIEGVLLVPEGVLPGMSIGSVSF